MIPQEPAFSEDRCAQLTLTVDLLEPFSTVTLPLTFKSGPFQTGEWSIEYDLDRSLITTAGKKSYHWALTFFLRWENVRKRVKLDSGSQMTIKTTASPAQTLAQVDLHEHCDEYFPGSAEGMGYIMYGWYTDLEASGKERAAFRLYLPSESANFGMLQSTGTEAAAFHSLLFGQQHLCDVRLYFPATQDTLWVSSKILRSKSPYFEQILSSGFSESTLTDSAQAMKLNDDQDAPLDADGLFEDSDLEDAEETTREAVIHPSSCGSKHYSITIRDAAYKTSKVVVWWLYSGRIDFSQLQSATSDITDDGNSVPSVDSKKEAVKEEQEKAENLPTTVVTKPAFTASPKSVYRLAKYLELEELATIALEGIRVQLTVNNIVQEAFGDFSRTFPDVQEMELEFLAENIQEVLSESDGISEVEKLMPEESEDGLTSIAPSLLNLVRLLA